MKTLSDLQPALGSIHSHIALSSKDWSFNESDAWRYGIVCGWDESSYQKLSKKFGWKDVHIEQNKKFHIAFESVFK